MMVNFHKTTFLFTLVLALLCLNACRKFEDFDTQLEIVIPTDCQDNTCAFYVLKTDRDGTTTEDWELTGLSGPFHYLQDLTGDEDITVTIDWESGVVAANIDPDASEISFYIEEAYESEPRVWETAFMKIKPGKIYAWDPDNETFEDTGERTEKKNTGGGFSLFSNDCDDLVKTWNLESLNGNMLEWTEYDDGTNSLTWTEGSINFTSSGNWSSTITSKQIIDGSTNYVPEEESGTYECEDGSVTLTNTSSEFGGTWNATVSDGELTWAVGDYSYVWK